MNDQCKIIYYMGDMEEMARYFNEKGFRIDVFVSIDKEVFEVYFFLASTLEYEMTLSGYCSYPGLIILEDITTQCRLVKKPGGCHLRTRVNVRSKLPRHPGPRIKVGGKLTTDADPGRVAAT